MLMEISIAHSEKPGLLFGIITKAHLSNGMDVYSSQDRHGEGAYLSENYRGKIITITYLVNSLIPFILNCI